MESKATTILNELAVAEARVRAWIVPVKRESPDRTLLEAFALLAAYSHHWPTRAGQGLCALAAEAVALPAAERGRFLKQRRVALARLAAAFARSPFSFTCA